MSDAQNAIVQEFLLESFENLSNINDEITQYEKNESDKELFNSIYRKIHTLKGSASFLGFNKLQEITHAVESILDFIRDGAIKVSSEWIDIFLESFDACMVILKNVETTGGEGDFQQADLVNRLRSRMEKGITKGENVVSDAPIPSKIEVGKVAQEPKTEVEEKKVEEKPVKVEGKKEVKKEEKKPASEVKAAPRQTITDSIVRVNVNLLDKIMNVVGELVINRNQILQYSKNQEDADLNRYAQQLNVITTELQTDIMTTRMQPVGSVFNKFERVVRDLSRNQKKKVKLEILGRDTELDKTLLESIKDPMTHLIRNSLDHGIESPEERIEKGKPEEGQLFIKAYHEGGQVIIEIVDDGNGINTARVKAKAVEKGILTPEEAEKLSHTKAQYLIFHAGFSTAEQVTNISGRGVGMDVVKSNIEKIGGEVEVISEEGVGTTFKLKIPLTLAIVPALVIESGNETFAIHQKNLVELVMLEPEEGDQIERLHGNEFFRLRGELIPIVRLNKILGLPDEDFDFAPPTNIIVLKAEGKIYGLVVDQVLDTQEIVVKPLSRRLKNLNLYAGATIMGDGRVALIVDAYGFYNMVEQKSDTAEKEVNSISEEVNYINADLQEILLVQLGDDRIYGIPLCLINRLEEVKKSQIEWSGTQPIVRYRGVPMSLIDLEGILELEGKSHINDNSNEDIAIGCVVVLIGEHYFGFAVHKIRDIAITESAIETDTVDREGLLGTMFINEKLITLIDVHKVIEQTPIGKNILQSQNGTLKGDVLLVEDSPLYQKIQTDLLIGLGLKVDVAENGRDGLEQFNGKTYNLIVTDIEMPEMDGFEMVEEIRKNNPSIPIIAVSTKVGERDRARGEEVGFDLHLEKLNKAEVAEAVAEQLSKE